MFGGITMNSDQQMFYDFVMQRARKGKEDEVRSILMEGIRKQDDGTFTKEYMDGIAPKLLALLRPECIGEFVKAAADMGSKARN